MVSELAEPITKWYADLMKLPNDEVAKQFADLGLFEGLNFLNNVLFEPLGAKIIGFLEGLGMHALAGYGPVAGRSKEDLQLIGSASMWALLDPKPEDLVNIANLIASLKSGFQFGTWSPLANAIGVKTPDRITRDFGNVGVAFQRAFGVVPRTTAPSTPSSPLVPLPSTPATLNGGLAGLPKKTEEAVLF